MANFKSKSIDLSDPRTFVVCQVCGAKRRMLNHRHLGTHDMDLLDYEMEYPDSPTCSELTRSLRSSLKRNRTKEDFKTLQDARNVGATVDADDPSTYIVCQVCKAKLGKLTSHHVELHGISMEFYRESFPDSPIVTDKFRRWLSAENSKRMQDPEYYAIMCENMQSGNDTMDHEARLAKSHATRKGRKNRLDHNCKGWTFLWESMTPEERSEFIDERYKIQSALPNSLPRGCTVHYIDRRLLPHTFKSRHELAFAIYLDILKLDWMYEGWSIPYKDSDGKDHKYWPDFVVHYPFLYFEVKPFGMGPAVQQKMKCVERSLENLIYIDHQEILDARTWRYVKCMQEGDTLDFTRLDFTLRIAA